MNFANLPDIVLEVYINDWDKGPITIQHALEDLNLGENLVAVEWEFVGGTDLQDKLAKFIAWTDDHIIMLNGANEGNDYMDYLSVYLRNPPKSTLPVPGHDFGVVNEVQTV